MVNFALGTFYQIWAPHRRITPDPKFVLTVALPRVSTALLRPPITEKPPKAPKSTKKTPKEACVHIHILHTVSIPYDSI